MLKHAHFVFYPIVIALLAVLVTAAGCKSKSVEDHLRDAKAFSEQGKYQEAVIELKNAAQADPKNGHVRFMLGKLYNEMHEARSAEPELRRAREFGAIEGGRVAAELARSMLLDGKFKALIDDPTLKPVPAFEKEATASIHAMRARAYLGMRRYSEAEQAVAEGRKVKTDSPDVLLADALIKAARGDRGGALDTINGILAVRPNAFEALMAKADILRLRGQPNDALPIYGELLKAKPNFLPALGARSGVYLSTGNVKEAQRDVDSMRKVAKNHPAANYLQSLIHFRTGNYREAQASIQQTLRVMPHYPPAMLMSGAIHYALGSFAQAETVLTQFLNVEPNNRYARKLLGATLLELNQGKRALEVIQPMLGKDLQDSTVLALAGNAHLSAGNAAAAGEFLEKATKVDPSSTNLRTSLARARLGAGDIESAIADLEAASEMDATKTDADYALAMTHLRRADYDRALAALDKLEKKLPNNPLPLNLRGIAYLGKKDMAAARKHFEQAVALDAGYFEASANLAELDFHDKKPAEARKRFERVLAKDPKHVRAMMALAQISARAGDMPQYVKWLEQAAKANPSLIEPHLELSKYYLSTGEARRALEAAFSAQRAAPKNADATDAVGVAQLATGDSNTALKTFTTLVELAPRSGLGHYRVASVRVVLKDYAGAESSLKAALALQPDFLQASDSLGRLYLVTLRYADAAKTAQQLQNRFPKHYSGFLLEGDVLLAQRNYPAALKAFERAAAIRPSSDTTAKLYMALARTGRAPEGEEKLRTWLTTNPGDRVIRHYLADAYLQTGRARPAQEQYEALVQATPDDTTALNNLAVAYQQLKDKRAVETAERAYKLAPDSAIVGDTLGWVLLENGETTRSLQILRQVAAKNPNIPVIRYHLAQALAKSGDRAAARKEIERLLADHKQFAEVEQAKALLSQL